MFRDVNFKCSFRASFRANGNDSNPTSPGCKAPALVIIRINVTEHGGKVVNPSEVGTRATRPGAVSVDEGCSGQTGPFQM